MIEYGLVYEQLPNKFVESVNEKLKQGWKLQGGVVVNFGFYQAVYREIKDNDLFEVQDEC